MLLAQELERHSARFPKHMPNLGVNVNGYITPKSSVNTNLIFVMQYTARLQ